MPLIICMAFFAILFICEALYFSSIKYRKHAELCRYYAVEHPRPIRSDRYLDILG